MRNFLRRLNDDHGFATVLVSMCMAALMGLTALAVDLGRAYLKRSALQTAADAGALAGANSLLAEGRDIEKLRLIVANYAARNLTEADAPAKALTDADIVFLRDGVPDEQDPNQVEVTITLTGLRENAFPLYFGKGRGQAAHGHQRELPGRFGGHVLEQVAQSPSSCPPSTNGTTQAAPGTKYYQNGTLDVESPQEMATVNVLGYTQDDVGTQIIIKPGDPSLTIVHRPVQPGGPAAR